MQLVRLGHQLGGLAFGIEALAAATLLVGLALFEVQLPAHRIDVEGGPVGVEVEDLVDGLLQQLGGVADHHDTAGVGLEEFTQPHDGVGVEVVGRLVEQQGVGIAEQDAGQLHTSALATGELVQRLGQHSIGEPQVRGDARRLRLGPVPAGGGQLGLGTVVAGHRLLTSRTAGGGHLLGELREALHDAVQSTRRQDALRCGDRQV